MKSMPVRTSRIVLIVIALGSGLTAFAGPEMLDVDTRTRARMAKERARTLAQQHRNAQQEKAQEQASRSFEPFGCGSQTIGQNNGSLDTEGRSGVAPPEEFQFASNGSNIVNGGGCR